MLEAAETSPETPTSQPPQDQPSPAQSSPDQPSHAQSQPGRAPIGYDDPPPAPGTRVLPRHGLPDRIMLFAGSIAAAVFLLALIVTFAWWRRHRITISRVTNIANGASSANGAGDGDGAMITQDMAADAIAVVAATSALPD